VVSLPRGQPLSIATCRAHSAAPTDLLASSWDDIKWFRKITKMRLCLKGVQVMMLLALMLMLPVLLLLLVLLLPLLVLLLVLRLLLLLRLLLVLTRALSLSADGRGCPAGGGARCRRHRPLQPRRPPARHRALWD